MGKKIKDANKRYTNRPSGKNHWTYKVSKEDNPNFDSNRTPKQLNNMCEAQQERQAKSRDSK